MSVVCAWLSGRAPTTPAKRKSCVKSKIAPQDVVVMVDILLSYPQEDP